jgi:hypothetical protein
MSRRLFSSAIALPQAGRGNQRRDFAVDVQVQAADLQAADTIRICNR